MKKLILTLATSILLTTSANALDTSISIGTVVPFGDEIRANAQEATFRIGNLSNGFNTSISYTNPDILHGGQQAFGLDILSAGIGWTKTWKRLSAYTDLFFAYPFINKEGSFAEAGLYKLHQLVPDLGYTGWKDWDIEVDPNFGGRVGLRYLWSGKNWKAGFDASLRYLVLDETLYNSDKDTKAYWAARGQDAYHMVVNPLNLSAGVFGFFGEINW